MVRLTYLGHSAFHLDDHEGHTVLVDPFIDGNPSAVHSPDDFTPQTILLTHAHNDHVGNTIDIAKRTGAKVIATHELGTWLGQQGVADAVTANLGGTVAFAGGTVKFVPAWHTSSYLHEGVFVAPGIPAGLVVRFGGQTIYFAGDTCLFSDMRLIGEEGLDVAILPIGDHFTMGPADAIKAIRLLEPKLVIPCHYDTFPLIEQDDQIFVKNVEEQTAARGLAMKPGESTDLA